MEGRKTGARAFVHRGGGVHIAGTVIACDASVGTELVFLSHAPALGVNARRALPRLGGGRRQVLTTDLTLALLGPAGDRLKAHALPAAYGRPFGLGDLRLEMFPSGFMPGAASLLCEHGGRRIVYAGPIGAPHASTDVRAADALCIDATFGREALTFPSRAQALADVGGAVRRVLADGGTPVVLVDPVAIAVDLGAALAVDRIGLCAHRSIVQAAAAYRDAGLPAPALQRFAGKVGQGEALLWPASERVPARRTGTRPRGLIAVSAEPARAAAAPGPGDSDSARVTFPTAADFAGLVRYIEASGAREVALVNAPGDDLPRALGALGIDVYTLGPPRQIDLFAA
jgi:putative mRNA 3-end processing factor